MNDKLISLAKKHGTPLYVYNGDVIIERYNIFKNAFSVKDLKIHYAAKALTNLSILKLFKELGSGLDCVSVEEIKLA
jgi:diaminopimelate decarboxylase